MNFKPQITNPSLWHLYPLLMSKNVCTMANDCNVSKELIRHPVLRYNARAQRTFRSGGVMLMRRATGCIKV